MSLEEEIVFSRHAVDQMHERNISGEDVREMIRFPDHLREQRDGLMRAMRRLTRDHQRYLCVVVYRNLPDQKRVVTAFLTSKLRKYLTSQ